MTSVKDFINADYTSTLQNLRHTEAQRPCWQVISIAVITTIALAAIIVGSCALHYPEMHIEEWGSIALITGGSLVLVVEGVLFLYLTCRTEDTNSKKFIEEQDRSLPRRLLNTNAQLSTATTGRQLTLTPLDKHTAETLNANPNNYPIITAAERRSIVIPDNGDLFYVFQEKESSSDLIVVGACGHNQFGGRFQKDAHGIYKNRHNSETLPKFLTSLKTQYPDIVQFNLILRPIPSDKPRD